MAHKVELDILDEKLLHEGHVTADYIKKDGWTALGIRDL